MNNEKALCEKLGEPVEIVTSWGKARRWQLSERVSIVSWPGNRTYVCFLPTTEQDSREFEWRAGDQSTWFRQNHPEYSAVNTCFFDDPRMPTFEEWLDKLLIAAKREYHHDH